MRRKSVVRERIDICACLMNVDIDHVIDSHLTVRVHVASVQYNAMLIECMHSMICTIMHLCHPISSNNDSLIMHVVLECSRS
jgi:hypothetical protein